MKDKWGRTPMSLASASTNPDKDLVLELLKRDPSYWTTKLIDQIADLTRKLDQISNLERESQDSEQIR